MSYVLSKLGALLIQPSFLTVSAIVVGLAVAGFTTRTRLGLRLSFGGVAFLLLAGFLPLGNAVVLPLEERFAGEALPGPREDVAGIIILGGFEDGWVSAGRGGLGVNEAAERLTEGVRLALRWPEAKVVFTGAAGGLFVSPTDAAAPVGRFLADVGIGEDRIVLERNAQNTYQNAQFAAALVKPRPDQRWVLVTSAYHMPRSIGVFRQAGFNVIAANVDYRTRGTQDLMRNFGSIPAGLQRLDLGVREWAGLLAYWLKGRTDAFLPGPRK